MIKIPSTNSISNNINGMLVPNMPEVLKVVPKCQSKNDLRVLKLSRYDDIYLTLSQVKLCSFHFTWSVANAKDGKFLVLRREKYVLFLFSFSYRSNSHVLYAIVNFYSKTLKKIFNLKYRRYTWIREVILKLNKIPPEVTIFL